MSMPELKVTALGADGKTYWLAQQTPLEIAEGSCGGCAFSHRRPGCFGAIASHACVQQVSVWCVWKEKATPAFGCDAESRGQGVCEKFCGSNLCVTSQS